MSPYKKVFYTKLAFDYSKSEESSVLGFSDLRKFTRVSAHRVRFICVQNVIFIMLHAF